MDSNAEATAGHSWRRLFTVAEANALLPSLIPTLVQLRTDKAALDEARVALARVTPAMRGNGYGIQAVELEQQIHELAQRIAAGVRGIVEQGIEVKDLDHGLIDFPSERDGRVVFLCWHLGEERLAWWHDLDAGFAGRQPL